MTAPLVASRAHLRIQFTLYATECRPGLAIAV